MVLCFFGATAVAFSGLFGRCLLQDVDEDPHCAPFIFCLGVLIATIGGHRRKSISARGVCFSPPFIGVLPFLETRQIRETLVASPQVEKGRCFIACTDS